MDQNINMKYLNDTEITWALGRVVIIINEN